MSFSPSSLLPSSPSKYLAVHLLIILSRLLEEQRRGGLGSSNSVAPFDGGKEQSGEEFESGRRQTAAQCTRKRVLPLFPLQTVFLSLIGHFTFPQTEKRVRQRRSKEKETQIRIVSFRPPPPPSFNCPSSHHQPLAFLISRSPRRCHTRTRSQKPGSG